MEEQKRKICRVCGTPFVMNAPNQVYCSDDCCEIAQIERAMSRANRTAEETDKRLKTRNINKKTKEIKQMWAKIILECEAAGLSYGEDVARGVIDG